jgi:hypothetical protein
MMTQIEMARDEAEAKKFAMKPCIKRKEEDS